jgi:hypothetical protein
MVTWDEDTGWRPVDTSDCAFTAPPKRKQRKVGQQSHDSKLISSASTCVRVHLHVLCWNKTCSIVCRLLCRLQLQVAVTAAAAAGGGDGCNNNGNSAGAAALQVNDCLRLHVC